MYTLEDSKIVEEVKCGNNFGYILENENYFMSTDYKVLQSQTNDIFVPCMKMMYNGKIELFYLTEDCRKMSSMLTGITTDALIQIVTGLLKNIVEVENNGFLSSENIDISWDKIFVDRNTLKVKLVYLPINFKIFHSHFEFESRLRSNLIKLVNQIAPSPDSRMEKFLTDLSNSSLSLKDLCSGGKWEESVSKKEDSVLRLVAINVPNHFEILLDQASTLIGKKAEIVDAVIPFNRMISRKHCRITRKDREYYISDEGSANGTYVNRTKLIPGQQYRIQRGDMIRLADSDFRIE